MLRTSAPLLLIENQTPNCKSHVRPTRSPNSMRHSILTIALILALPAFSTEERPLHQAQDKPNIILIMTDDMGFECLGVNGSVSYNTPNLDRMAQEGVRYTHCYYQPITF